MTEKRRKRRRRTHINNRWFYFTSVPRSTRYNKHTRVSDCDCLCFHGNQQQTWARPLGLSDASLTRASAQFSSKCLVSSSPPEFTGWWTTAGGANKPPQKKKINHIPTETIFFFVVLFWLFLWISSLSVSALKPKSAGWSLVWSFWLSAHILTSGLMSRLHFLFLKGVTSHQNKSLHWNSLLIFYQHFPHVSLKYSSRCVTMVTQAAGVCSWSPAHIPLD